MVARISAEANATDSAVTGSDLRRLRSADELPMLVPPEVLMRFARFEFGPLGIVRAELAAPGTGAFGRVALGSCSFRRDQRHAAPLEAGSMLVLAIERGRAEGIGARGAFAAGKGDVLLIDLDELLPARCEELEAHFAVLPPWHCDARMVLSGGWHGAVLPRSGGIGSLLRTAIGFVLDGEVDDFSGLCASIGALLSAGYAHAVGPVAVEGGGPPASLRRFIEANLGDPDLSAARLAREFGMARASLYRHFDQLGGIAAYVRRLRLRRARELIERSGTQTLRLSAIATEVGFASPTVFARAFRQAYGMTPRECLMRVRAGQSAGARRADARG